MEEKEVTMSGQETPKTTDEKDHQKEMSYDELKNIATQLAQQNRALQGRVNDLANQLEQTAGIQARLHYLFKILENKFAFDSEYIITIADEIKEIMTLDKEEPKEETKE